MLADQRLGVQVVFDDEGEVTLRVPDLGILGFGDTYEESGRGPVVRVGSLYAASYFQNPVSVRVRPREPA